jgi:hypothetical protein
MKYQSGEAIMKDDRVLFHAKPATIEFVAIGPDDPDPAIAWHLRGSGGGIMILQPGGFGRAFISHDALSEYEDLEFVGRG